MFRGNHREATLFKFVLNVQDKQLLVGVSCLPVYTNTSQLTEVYVPLLGILLIVKVTLKTCGADGTNKQTNRKQENKTFCFC